ncbi:hypothetical protein A4249_06970 [Brevundimonas sp. GW460-12-10-14-LB2]|uniref:hypothetical protein n=1 Tax=Brevundimonas sp. GW460-12-10-14-LB2 TaxID=1827469 RepID=UPI0007BC88BC|nr:hypothetical protein [Brevundimonas sp. GW460-12-10-14-LB2]ANC53420.1 hypothetical protein A4249_06970 [Brevundimonas sp. GW460-12-10-14-LB2]
MTASDPDALENLADEIDQRSQSCLSLTTDEDEDISNVRLFAKAQAYKHSATLVRAFLARNGKGEG